MEIFPSVFGDQIALYTTANAPPANMTVRKAVIPTMSPEALAIVRRMEDVVRQMPQEPFKLDEFLHGGVYTRMVTLPPGYWGGAEVAGETTLIIIGAATIFTGEDEGLPVSGVTVLPAAAGRKQAFVTKDYVTLVMVAATDAATTEDAVLALCAEPEILRAGV